MMQQHAYLLDRIVAIAETAGKIALRHFPEHQHYSHAPARLSNHRVEWKEDNSPVTVADVKIDRFITNELTSLTSHIPVISEESHNSDWNERKGWQQVWIVDPLDGTRHYISGKKDYSINIALVQEGKPQLSVVLAPSHQLCYYAIRNQGAYKSAQTKDIQLHCSHQASSLMRVIISHGVPGWKLRSHLKHYPQYQFIRLGSSLKQCWIAEGLADVYPRFGKTSEWDTAAAQLILEEAGGRIVNSAGNTLVYNKQNLDNPEFIAHAPWYQIPSPWYNEGDR